MKPHIAGRQFTLVKPNYRFAGLARTEWQIFSYLSSSLAFDQVRYGFNSRVIFSGTKDDCIAILEGHEYALREYRSGREICRGHYTPSGVFVTARIPAIAEVHTNV